MERGVVVGGLMICGSFLLAVLLNRSAMEELPPAPAIAAPMSAPASGAKVAPGSSECTKVDPAANTRSTTEPEPPALDGCADPD